MFIDTQLMRFSIYIHSENNLRLVRTKGKNRVLMARHLWPNEVEVIKTFKGYANLFWQKCKHIVSPYFKNI